MSTETNLCPYCKHTLENNQHGIDQNDVYLNDDKQGFEHGGTCTYCRHCNPRLDQILKAKGK